MQTALQVAEHMVRGDSYNLTMVILDENNTAYDLTDIDAVYLHLYASLTDDTPVITKQAQIIDAVGGEVRFQFIPADTASLAARAYDLEVKVTQGNKVWTVFQGKFGILLAGGG
jgi:hypothetical protein